MRKQKKLKHRLSKSQLKKRAEKIGKRLEERLTRIGK